MEKEKQKIELYIPKERYAEFDKLLRLNLHRIGIPHFSNIFVKIVIAVMKTNRGEEILKGGK